MHGHTTLEKRKNVDHKRLVYLIGPHLTLSSLWNKGAFPNCQIEPVEGLRNYVTGVVRRH